MKILFSDWTLPYLLKDANFPVGGWAVELSSWVHGLESLGCEVEVLTWLGAQEYIGKQTSVKLREAYRLRGGIKFFRYFYDRIPSIVEATRKAAPDAVIQACSGIDTAIMAIAARYAGATYIHRIANDCDVDDRLSTIARPYERLAFRWGIRRTDAIVCQNSYQLGRIQTLYPGRPATVIHNPFRPSESIGPVEKDQLPYVAWIANFGPAKNVPLLNSIAARNPHVVFRVAGALSGLANASTREAVAALERLPNVTMMGYLSRQQVPEFLGRARYLLSTSLFEGMSNTFLEALSVGTPIICPARVDPDGIVARHHLGFVAADDEELSRLVDRAAALDQSAYQEQSNRSRKYVREANDPRRIARQLTDFLEAARLTRASRLEFPT